MKRRICVGLTVLFLALGSSAFASYSCFDGNLSFDWVSPNALFPPAVADPFAAVSTLRVMSVSEGRPRYILENDNGTYEKHLIYTADRYPDGNLYLHLKTGADIGFFRISVADVLTTELTLQACLNSVFQGFGGADVLGFDGIFFLGVNARLFDALTFRVGLQHYSGHYGDETLENVSDTTGSNVFDVSTVDYCRDNDFAVGLSVRPVEPLRLYATASLPFEKSWRGERILVPSWVRKPSSGEPYGYNDYPDSYRDWIVQTGAEYSVPVPTVGSLVLALDVKHYQEGQITAAFFDPAWEYDPSAPWETECTVGCALCFDSGPSGISARIEAYYHDGRFPLLNYFYQRTQYVTAGCSVAY